MINLFNIVNGKVVIDPESLAIPPFQEFWESFTDKSIPSNEIKYCSLLHRWDTPYKAYDLKERERVLKQQIFKTEDYIFSDQYKNFEKQFIRFMATPSSRLLDAAEEGIEFLIEEYKNLRSKEGIDAGDVSKWMKELGGVIKSYDQLRDQVKTEQAINKRAKGNNTIGYFEIPIKK